VRIHYYRVDWNPGSLMASVYFPRGDVSANVSTLYKASFRIYIYTYMHKFAVTEIYIDHIHKFSYGDLYKTHIYISLQLSRYIHVYIDHTYICL